MVRIPCVAKRLLCANFPVYQGELSCRVHRYPLIVVCFITYTFIYLSIYWFDYSFILFDLIMFMATKLCAAPNLCCASFRVFWGELNDGFCRETQIDMFLLELWLERLLMKGNHVCANIHAFQGELRVVFCRKNGN